MFIQCLKYAEPSIETDLKEKNYVDVAPNLKGINLLNKSANYEKQTDMCRESPKRARKNYWSGMVLVGCRVRGANFWGLFSEHPLGASVEISADGTHHKCIFLFILSLVPWRNLAPRVLWRSNKSASSLVIYRQMLLVHREVISFFSLPAGFYN